jgi:hypothetical protein
LADGALSYSEFLLFSPVILGSPVRGYTKDDLRHLPTIFCNFGTVELRLSNFNAFYG